MQRELLIEKMTLVHNTLFSDQIDNECKKELIAKSINEICKIQNRGITCWDGLKFWDDKKTITTRFDVLRAMVDFYVNHLIHGLVKNNKLPTLIPDEDTACAYNTTIRTWAAMDEKIQLLCHLFNMPDLLEDTLKNHKVGSMEEGGRIFKKSCDDTERREDEIKNLINGALTYSSPSI